jgi:hypothetical protein
MRRAHFYQAFLKYVADAFIWAEISLSILIVVSRKDSRKRRLFG